MSWSTTLTVEAAENELPVLTDELVEQARNAVLSQLDQYKEHDTFDAAVAAAKEMLQFGPGTRFVSLSGHAGSSYRNSSAGVSIPTEGT